MNTDPFPTPPGALSPDGVTAAVPHPHAAEFCADPIHDNDPLGVPGYAGAKGAVPEPQYEPDPNMQPGVDLGQYSPGFGETPEPQGPTTEAGRDLLAHAVQYNPLDADKAVIAAKIGAIEAEARAAARPNIDVDQVLRYLRSSRTRRDLAEAIGGETARDNEVYLRMATNILAKLQARRLASPDATRREPSGE